MSVLIETMRREGYELEAGRPEVVYREIDGVKCEPIERLTVDIPEEFTGTIMDSIIARRGEMVNMMPTAGILRLSRIRNAITAPL